jgi:hypothetical protein
MDNVQEANNCDNLPLSQTSERVTLQCPNTKLTILIIVSVTKKQWVIRLEMSPTDKL